LTPNPLPRGEREPEVPAAKSVFANSTILPIEGPALRFRSRWLEGLAVRKRGGPGPRHTPPPSRPRLTAAPGRRPTASWTRGDAVQVFVHVLRIAEYIVRGMNFATSM